MILAGTSIQLIGGSNGILSTASSAVDKNNVETAKEQVTFKIAEYKSDYYDEKYVLCEIGQEVQSGDWIYSECEGKKIETNDYEFTISIPDERNEADEEHPYIVTIEKNSRLKTPITGTLSIDGILEWDTSYVANDNTSEEETAENVTVSIAFNKNNKLTEGTEISFDAKAESGINKIDLTIGDMIVYSENIEGVKSYNKILKIDDLNNLENLMFNDSYIAKLEVTTHNNNHEESTEIVKNYTVGSEEALKTLAREVNKGTSLEGETILQIADINLDGNTTNQWTAIGTSSKQFKGIYKGQNHTISGIYISNSSSYQGLFGYTSGVIDGIKVSGYIEAGSYVGGISGYNSGTIKNCGNYTVISGSTTVGGICGCNIGTICSSMNAGNVSAGMKDVGGIVGMTQTPSIIYNVYNMGTIIGKSCDINNVTAAGGIIGLNMSNCNLYVAYNIGNVVAAKNRAGGIIGTHENSANLSYAYSNATVSSNGTVATVDVSSSGSYLGKIIGLNYRASYSNIQSGTIPSYTALNKDSNTLGFGNSVWSYKTGEMYPVLFWEI